MRPVNEIIVHCTATPEGREVSVAEIDRWHKERGWKGIGYHWVVHLDGRVEAGRPEAEVGAHVAGHNVGTLGVVYVGGVDAAMKAKDTRTPEQKAGIAAKIVDILARHPGITMISGHHDYAAKACPCFPSRQEYAELLNRAKPLPSPSPGNKAPVSGTGTIAASVLNLRDAPDGRDIGNMPKGTVVLIHGRDGDWLNVETPFGAKGWAAARYVSVGSEDPVVEARTDLPSSFDQKAPWIIASLMRDIPAWGEEDCFGCLGNLGHESGGLATLQEVRPSSGRGGYGWAMWTGFRRDAFESWCKAKGLSPSSDEANYRFLVHELRTSEKRTVPDVAAAVGRTAKVRAFEAAFERARIKHFESRVAWADKAAAAWASASPEDKIAPFERSQETVAMPAEAKPLTPIEQMNKPVTGALTGTGSMGVGAAAILLAQSAGWFPEVWSSGAPAVALGIVGGWAFTQIGNFVGSYLARDKRFQ